MVTAEELGSEAVVAWLDRYGHDVVVVRPDRYVLGAGKSLDDLTDRVRHALAIKLLSEGEHGRLHELVSDVTQA